MLHFPMLCYDLVQYGMHALLFLLCNVTFAIEWNAKPCCARLRYAILRHCNIHLAISDQSLYTTRKNSSCSPPKCSPPASLLAFFPPPFVCRQWLPGTNLKVKSSDEGNLVAVWASRRVTASHRVTVWVGCVVPPAIGLRGVT